MYLGVYSQAAWQACSLETGRRTGRTAGHRAAFALGAFGSCVGLPTPARHRAGAVRLPRPRHDLQHRVPGPGRAAAGPGHLLLRALPEGTRAAPRIVARFRGCTSCSPPLCRASSSVPYPLQSIQTCFLPFLRASGMSRTLRRGSRGRCWCASPWRSGARAARPCSRCPAATTSLRPGRGRRALWKLGDRAKWCGCETAVTRRGT